MTGLDYLNTLPKLYEFSHKIVFWLSLQKLKTEIIFSFTKMSLYPQLWRQNFNLLQKKYEKLVFLCFLMFHNIHLQSNKIYSYFIFNFIYFFRCLTKYFFWENFSIKTDDRATKITRTRDKLNIQRFYEGDNIISL